MHRRDTQIQQYSCCRYQRIVLSGLVLRFKRNAHKDSVEAQKIDDEEHDHSDYCQDVEVGQAWLFRKRFQNSLQLVCKVRTVVLLIITLHIWTKAWKQLLACERQENRDLIHTDFVDPLSGFFFKLLQFIHVCPSNNNACRMLFYRLLLLILLFHRVDVIKDKVEVSGPY